MLYVYAIIAGPGEVGDLPGEGILPGTPVGCLSRNGLTAVVSDVPAEIFGEASLRTLLEDSAWTRERVMAHERVVADLAPRHTVLPLKFCTLFSASDRIVRLMEQHRDELEAVLAHIRGAREWGVKVFYDPCRLRRRVDSSMAAEPEPAPAGAAFFARKQHERRLRQEMEARVSSCAEDSHRRVSRIARAAIAVALQSPALHGRRDEMALNGAYLVADGGEATLRDCLRELTETYSSHGFDFVLTGPWAPYNFTRMHFGELPQFERVAP